MTFADFLIDVPGPLRLLLCIALYVGFSLLAVRVFHDRAIALAQEVDDRVLAKQAEEREANEKAIAEFRLKAEARAAGLPEPELPIEEPKPWAPPPPKTPESWNITGRGMQFLNVAFVFLLVFTVGQFWGNQRSADDANVQEASSYSKAVLLTRELPEGPQKDALLAGLEAYRVNVLDLQWPQLEQADTVAAYRLQAEAGEGLIRAQAAAMTASTENSSLVSEIGSTMSDMTSYGVDRISSLPGTNAPRVLLLVFLLSIVNLGLIIAFQPARRRLMYAVIALIASVTALLMFVVVEVSNPYLPSGLQPMMGILS